MKNDVLQQPNTSGGTETDSTSRVRMGVNVGWCHGVTDVSWCTTWQPNWVFQAGNGYIN